MNAKQKLKLLKFITDHEPELLSKQTLAKMADKEQFAKHVESVLAHAVQIQQSALHFKPHGLCGSVAINIIIFDKVVKDGYKLNLITGKYAKASRRTRRAH